MNYNVEINGLEVNAYYSEKNINEIFIPLLKKFEMLRKEKGSRVLIMLAAPPGAGKSTLLSFLKYLSENTEGISPITTIGMDGFHHYQDYLMSHTVVRSGKEISMVQIKGAPITFDLDLLIEGVKKVASGEECGWPTYDRLLHNPTENAVTVTGDIILLEGNYLLLKDEGWCELKKYADYTIKIDADIDLLRERLINRKMLTRTDRESAREFVESSDLYNARLCIENSENADMLLRLQDNNEYTLIS